MRQVIAALFPDEAPLVYRTTMQGRLLSTCWTSYGGETAPGLHIFDIFTEIDPAAMGAGGSIVRAHASLLVGEDMSPVRYRTSTAGAQAEVRIGPDAFEVTLPNGQTHSVAREGADWILEVHVAGLDALMFARLAARGGLEAPRRLRFLLLNQMMLVPYSLEPNPDAEAPPGCRWLRSSWEEELLVDEQGVLQLSRVAKHGVESERVEGGAELPAWRHEPLWSNLKPARYAPPEHASFRLENVEIDGSDVPIGGALTVPAGPGPHPAVLFIGGSGRHDRHGMVGEIDGGYHEIVDRLAEAGFVGLRFDKRGMGTTAVGPDPLDSGLGKHIDDTKAAYEYVVGRPEVDPKRVFLIGHSQGAQIALILATKLGVEPAGLVLLGGAGRPIDEVVMEQVGTVAEQRGMDAGQRDAQVAEARQFLELCKQGRELVEDEVPDLMLLGARHAPWLRDHLRYQLREMLPEVTVPVAAFVGDKDFNVYSGWNDILDAARQSGVEVDARVLPGLDHHFKPVEGESKLADLWTDRRVDDAFLDALASWLRARARHHGARS